MSIRLYNTMHGKKEEFVVGGAVQNCLDFESEIVNKSGWRRLSAFVGFRC